jgi:hypothetical protein
LVLIRHSTVLKQETNTLLRKICSYLDTAARKPNFTSQQAILCCVLHKPDKSDHTAIINHLLIDEVACVVGWGEEEKEEGNGISIQAASNGLSHSSCTAQSFRSSDPPQTFVSTLDSLVS